MDRSTTVAQFRRPSLHNRLVSRASLGGSFSGRRMGHQQRLDRVRWIASTMDDRYTVPGTDSPLRRGCARSHLESQSQRGRADRDVCPRPELKAGVWLAPASSVSRRLTKILYRDRGAPLQAVTWFSAMTLPTVSRFFVFMGMPSVDNTQTTNLGI